MMAKKLLIVLTGVESILALILSVPDKDIYFLLMSGLALFICFDMVKGYKTEEEKPK